MVTVSKVVQWLELLIDDPDASFVCTVGDFFNVFSRLAHIRQLLVDDLGSLNGCLGVKFRWNEGLE